MMIDAMDTETTAAAEQTSRSSSSSSSSSLVGTNRLASSVILLEQHQQQDSTGVIVYDPPPIRKRSRRCSGSNRDINELQEATVSFGPQSHSNPITDSSSSEMQVDTILSSFAPKQQQQQQISQADEVLSQMIQQSGAQTYEQVVQFCVDTGIPISRMLRLDLMRLIGSSSSFFERNNSAAAADDDDDDMMMMTTNDKYYNQNNNHQS